MIKMGNFENFWTPRGVFPPFPLEGYFSNLAQKKVFHEKNVKFVISEACDPQKIPKNI